MSSIVKAFSDVVGSIIEFFRSVVNTIFSLVQSIFAMAGSLLNKFAHLFGGLLQFLFEHIFVIGTLLAAISAYVIYAQRQPKTIPAKKTS